jgi:class 3 adenylate cyclase
MMEQREYVGRPLNIASRLQAALSQIDPSPAYKVLVPRPTYYQMCGAKDHHPQTIKVPLKNIQGELISDALS